MDAFRLDGRVALVTGGTSGIGAACAEVLAEAGAAVVVAGRNAQRGQAVADGIARAGGRARFQALDVTDDGSCRAAVQAATAGFGRLDIVVNNAGVSRGGAVLDTTDDDWLAAFETNLTGVFRVCRAAVPPLRAGGGGAIVNIGSDWSLFAGAGAAAYCASKGGVLLLTKAMAQDHARQGIRVNCVCPAEIDTPMLATTADRHGVDHAEALMRYAEALPVGRVGTPREVAYAVLYLASDAARFITGIALPVDGGSTSR